MQDTLRVLLVEDDENKRLQIVNTLNTRSEVGSITQAKSYKSGLRALLGEEFDLVLLDMTLPMFDVGPNEHGGKTEVYAGRDLFKQMERRRIFTPVILITQYTSFGEGEEQLTLDELDSHLGKQHPNQYLGHVYYDAVQEEWKTTLDNLLASFSD